jgi:hypothetical protein
VWRKEGELALVFIDTLKYCYCPDIYRYYQVDLMNCERVSTSFVSGTVHCAAIQV